MRARLSFLLAPVVLAAAAAACGSTPQDASCPTDLPACPAQPPSYQHDVAPILAAKCASCHGPGGIESSRPFQTYDQVFAQRQEMLDRVYSCFMPPADGTPLTSAERTTLLEWFRCQAPNN
jgi:uncharacterized membrane protein